MFEHHMKLNHNQNSFHPRNVMEHNGKIKNVTHHGILKDAGREFLAHEAEESSRLQDVEKESPFLSCMYCRIDFLMDNVVSLIHYKK